jgi:hypothetical protein
VLVFFASEDGRVSSLVAAVAVMEWYHGTVRRLMNVV